MGKMIAVVERFSGEVLADIPSEQPLPAWVAEKLDKDDCRLMAEVNGQWVTLAGTND